MKYKNFNFTPFEAHQIIYSLIKNNSKILDLGCGVGFWTVELQLRGKFDNVYSADLTQRALDLTRKRSPAFPV